MPQSLQLTHATDLMLRAYRGRAALPPLLVNRMPKFAQSYLTTDGILIIPGVNERTDKRLAKRQSHVSGWWAHWDKLNTTISSAIWIQVFAEYAYEVAKVFAPHRPRIIIGHSLGAGMTQILTQHYNCPGICFSSPAVKSHRGISLPDRHDVLNVQTRGDWLPAILPHGPVIKRIGHTVTIPADGPGNAHAMKTYAASVAKRPTGLPLSWQMRP